MSGQSSPQVGGPVPTGALWNWTAVPAGQQPVDAAALRSACDAAARRFVGFDMAEVVERQGSVISAVMVKQS